jgi:CRP-like cAMP-binding protein
MQNEKFFDRLLLLPLFQGIGKNDFWEIAEQIKIAFHKKAAGHVLARQGDLCDRLYFIMGGTLRIERPSDDRRYRLSEWNDRPTVVQSECLFGLTTRYTRDYIAETDLQYFEIDKAAIREVLFFYPTFRLNYLNMLSGMIQTSAKHTWRSQPDDLAERFTKFVADRAVKPAGRKEMWIDMPTLADELLTTRLNVSRMLNKLADEGLICISRKKIIIPQLEKLIQAYH